MKAQSEEGNKTAGELMKGKLNCILFVCFLLCLCFFSSKHLRKPLKGGKEEEVIMIMFKKNPNQSDRTVGTTFCNIRFNAK